jgi:hypothetical protein
VFAAGSTKASVGMLALPCCRVTMPPDGGGAAGKGTLLVAEEGRPCFPATGSLLC